MPISRREFLKASGGTVAGFLARCVTTSKSYEKPVLKVPVGPADLILHHGNILTVGGMGAGSL